VVHVIDYGTHGDAPCLVMEYVEGETLETVLVREAPLSVDRVERLLQQLAQGLSAIHAKGIVHRDLKPDNVVITKTAAGTEQARLLDFGIARLMAPDEEVTAEKASVTQAGIVLGTPEYVSPEQALGQPLDARSDLYALGVILFRALTGKHPFPGPTPREFISQHIHSPPPALLDAAPHLSGFPSLVAAVTGCLEKDPRNRPQTAAEIVTLSTSRPLTLSTTVPPPSALRPSGMKVPWKYAVAGGLLFALGLFALGFNWYNEPTRKAHRLVDEGRGSEALQVLEDLGPRGQTWSLQQLRATALHQVGRHEEEWKVMSAAPQNEPLEPMALEALADDFGHAETPKLRKLIASLPKAMLLPTFQALAKEEMQWKQWGALRFVDLEYAGQGLPLQELYVRALEGRDCSTRRVAAKRLVEFRSTDAIPPLEKLKSIPKKKGEEDCGQAAAEAALKQLAKE
jgi:hypothetical protein